MAKATVATLFKTHSFLAQSRIDFGNGPLAQHALIGLLSECGVEVELPDESSKFILEAIEDARCSYPRLVCD
jgi:hypothetical protein